MSKNNNQHSDTDVIWVSDFTEDALKRFYADFKRLEEDDTIQVINVVISSYGGSVYDLIGMRDLIKNSSKVVMTTGLGKAMSCGAVLLAAGTKGFRFITENSEMLIHEVASFSYGKTSDLKENAANVQQLNEKLISWLSEDSKLSVAAIKKEMSSRNNADWILSAQEALDCGFVDKIGIPKIAVDKVQSIYETAKKPKSRKSK